MKVPEGVLEMYPEARSGRHVVIVSLAAAALVALLLVGGCVGNGEGEEKGPSGEGQGAPGRSR